MEKEKPIKFRTHYDNLQVSRKASPEVIRAAYKSLSIKYHPDTNPDNPEAVRIMRIINEAYETLSDPVKKKFHDQWIEEMLNEPYEDEIKENIYPQNTVNVNSGNYSTRETTNKPRDVFYTPSATLYLILYLRRWWILYGDHIKKWWFLYIIFIIMILGYFNTEHHNTNNTPTMAEQPAVSEAPNQTTSYVRPITAPNGTPWPEMSGYIKGYKIRYRNGLSTLTIDNTQTSNDVYLKLYTLDAQTPFATRHVFIKAGDKFTIKSIRAGNYDVRYCILDMGTLLKSESFNLQEIKEFDGIKYSDVTMTLYKVANGNMQTTPINDTDFEDGISDEVQTQ